MNEIKAVAKKSKVYSRETVKSNLLFIMFLFTILQLSKVEIPKKIMLLPDPWTPEDGLLTGAFKLKRKAVGDRFKDEIEVFVY